MAESRSPTLLDRAWRLALWMAYRILLAGWFVFRPRRRGVFIAVWHGDEVIVIRNSYRSWYALPAGGIKRSETPLQAAVRELREEVGVEVSPEDLRFVADFPTTFEFKRDVCSFFELELAQEPPLRLDGREVVWADFVSVTEARALRMAPPVRAYLEARGS